MVMGEAAKRVMIFGCSEQNFSHHLVAVEGSRLSLFFFICKIEPIVNSI